MFKRLVADSEASNQGKIAFISANSGHGKSTFVHSLEVFLADKVGRVVRLPKPHELDILDIPSWCASLPESSKLTIVNFDGREAPSFDEATYRTFLGSLNGILRDRSDLIVLWPVNDPAFATSIVDLLTLAGGTSAFGPSAVYELSGLGRSQYRLVLEKILQVANWRLDDAAITDSDIDEITEVSDTIGIFLDKLRRLIVDRFDVEGMGIEFPTLVFAISGGAPGLREVCRALRRADSFYLEASRLLMYTKKSNAAEWWQNKAQDPKSALPHVIAYFNAQIASLSASSVVHSILHSDDIELKNLVKDVRADRGNASRIMKASELYKFATGDPVDNREYGSSVKEATYDSYGRIQSESATKHKAINKSIIDMAIKSGAELEGLTLETQIVPGLQADAVGSIGGDNTAIEFHHKAAAEATQNKISIYVLDKLREYAINYGLAKR